MSCGLLGTLIQYVSQLDKQNRHDIYVILMMIFIGLLFGPINLLVTFDDS